MSSGHENSNVSSNHVNSNIIYQFKSDTFDESMKNLNEKLANKSSINGDFFDVLVSIKDLEKQIKIHEKQTIVMCCIFFVCLFCFFRRMSCCTCIFVNYGLFCG